ncbi:acetyl-CoA carboxylase biotin carboxyl carrier protein [bacterium NHP-B]|nr:acetyl-CoA carboxylase biotin carboxyl carrier protein [bacterium NHP-B]
MSSPGSLFKEMKTILDDSDFVEVEYQKGDTRIRLVRPSPTSMTVAPAAEIVTVQPPQVVSSTKPELASSKEEATDNSFSVTSPMVGMVYLAPEPNAKPFVQKGDVVQEGQTLLIIEAMKVMNPLRAQKSGVIQDILVHNAQPVEFGELLVKIELS